MTTTNSFPETSLVDSLRELHEVYADAVNRAVAEDRDDLVQELVSEYDEEAMKLMSRVLPFADAQRFFKPTANRLSPAATTTYCVPSSA